MRILLVSLNFAPELLGIGRVNTDIARWLAQRGHELHVVCAPPHYPAWRVPPGYPRFGYRGERLEGAQVWRCPTYVPARPGGFRRLLHQVSFGLSCAPVLLMLAMRRRPDVVVAVEPPLAALPAALAAAALGRARTVLHVQDLEIDMAFEMGMLPRWLRPAAETVERVLLRLVDRIVTVSPAMAERLRGKRPGRVPVEVVGNWVDTDVVRPLASPGTLRADWGIGPDEVVALYCGSMGEKHGLEIILAAARGLQDEPGLSFVFCGSGPALERLKREAAGAANVRFVPVQPEERLCDLMNAADIHLLPQRAEASELAMPSKLGGILASGRASVVSAQQGGPVNRAVDGCALTVPPGDAGAFADAIRQLARDGERRRALGRRARERAEAEWSRAALLRRLEAILAGAG